MNIRRILILVLVIPILAGMVSCNALEPISPAGNSGEPDMSGISEDEFIRRTEIVP